MVTVITFYQEAQQYGTGSAREGISNIYFLTWHKFDVGF